HSFPARRSSDLIHPVARVNASMVRALASSSPSTLTKIFTWRRSPDTSTSVTVTNPTRGSLSLRMMSLASRLISSRILWIRWPAMTSNLPSTPPPTAGSAPLHAPLAHLGAVPPLRASRRPLERPFHVAPGRPDARDSDPRPLVRVQNSHLGDGDSQPGLHAVDEPVEHPALLLE